MKDVEIVIETITSSPTPGGDESCLVGDVPQDGATPLVVALDLKQISIK